MAVVLFFHSVNKKTLLADYAGRGLKTILTVPLSPVFTGVLIFIINLMIPLSLET
jgi:hypothetical protein